MFEAQEMPYGLCKDLLASGVLGRVAICTPSGPMILPVNHVVVDESVVVRTAPDSPLGSVGAGSRLAFEVDFADYHYHRAWSVLAVGPCTVSADDPDLVDLAWPWQPQPWAAGERPLYVRLVWDELTGRQLGPNWDPRRDLPVRQVRR